MLMVVSEMAFHTCDEIQAFKEAFDAFDWNKSGTISYKSLQVRYCDIVLTEASFRTNRESEDF